MAWVIPSRRLRGHRGWRSARLQLPKHVRKTGKANTMADLPPDRPGSALKADGLLAPGAHNPEIALAGEGLVRSRDQHVRRGDERPRVVHQLATAVDFHTTDREHGWGWHTVRSS